MKTHSHILVQKAKKAFNAYQFITVYQLLRRYFDRLPFESADKDHAETIGIFTRTLAELGKLRELQFYATELERLYAKTQSADAGYCLSVAYAYSMPPRLKAAKMILEEILRVPNLGNDLDIRAKMLLSHFYAKGGDFYAPVALIKSIKKVPADETLAQLLVIWRAIAKRYQNQLEDSEAILLELLTKLDLNQSWYPYFCAMDGLVNTWLRQGRLNKAEEGIREIKRLFVAHRFKTVHFQVKDLERDLRKQLESREVRASKTRESLTVGYSGKFIRFQRGQTLKKTAELILSKRTVSKRDLLSLVYGESVQSDFKSTQFEEDFNKFKEKLRALGLPEESMTQTKTKIQFLPKIIWKEKENENS